MRVLTIMLFAATFFAGCRCNPPDGRTARDTADLASGRPTICEIHKAEMSVQKVKLEFGMKMFTPEDDARTRLFPHAAEPFDTGFCMPTVEKYALVFICTACTEARTIWFNANKPIHK